MEKRYNRFDSEKNDFNAEVDKLNDELDREVESMKTGEYSCRAEYNFPIKYHPPSKFKKAKITESRLYKYTETSIESDPLKPNSDKQDLIKYIVSCYEYVLEYLEEILPDKYKQNAFWSPIFNNRDSIHKQLFLVSTLYKQGHYITIKDEVVFDEELAAIYDFQPIFSFITSLYNEVIFLKSDLSEQIKPKDLIRFFQLGRDFEKIFFVQCEKIITSKQKQATEISKSKEKIGDQRVSSFVDWLIEKRLVVSYEDFKQKYYNLRQEYIRSDWTGVFLREVEGKRNTKATRNALSQLVVSKLKSPGYVYLDKYT